MFFRPIPQFDAEPSSIASLSRSAVADPGDSGIPSLAAPTPPGMPTSVGVAWGNLQAMSHASDGAVDVRWTPRGILLSLQLASNLKPGSSFVDVLSCCAHIFFGEDGEFLVRHLEAGTLKVPSLQLLRSARVRLDIMNILFERSISAEWCFKRYILVAFHNVNGWL